MKLKKIKQKKNKLIKLQALKLYSRKKTNHNTNLAQTQTQLKKMSNIIFRYHLADKKILFLGFPVSFAEILKNTKHKVVPEFVWFNGVLNNRTSFNVSKAGKKTSLNTFKLLLNVKKKLDLIVIYNENKKSTAIQESYSARIPTISISEKLNFNLKTTYESIGNYDLVSEKSENNNFFFSFIRAILIKAKNGKKTKEYKTLKTLKNIYTKEWGAKTRNLARKN